MAGRVPRSRSASPHAAEAELDVVPVRDAVDVGRAVHRLHDAEEAAAAEDLAARRVPAAPASPGPFEYVAGEVEHAFGGRALRVLPDRGRGVGRVDPLVPVELVLRRRVAPWIDAASGAAR